MDTHVTTILVRRGQAGEPLADRARRDLDPALAAARRGATSAIAIDVEADAWDWEWDGRPTPSATIAREHHDLVARLHSAGVPVVVRLDGAVAGLGLALALACDLRFVAETARLRVGRAASPGALVSGLPWLLRDRLGPSRALELMLTGRELDAAQARSVGVACDGSFDDLVHALRCAPASTTSALVRSLAGPAVAAFAEHLSYEAWLGELATAGDGRA